MARRPSSSGRSGRAGLAIRARARAGPVREAWLKLVTGLMPEASNIFAASLPSPDEGEPRRRTGFFRPRWPTGRPVMRSGLSGVGQWRDAGAVDGRTHDKLDCAALNRQLRLTGARCVSSAPAFPGDLEARFILIALDEGIDDDEILPSASWPNRLGLTIALEGVSHRALGSCRVDHALIAAARARLAEGDSSATTICCRR